MKRAALHNLGCKVNAYETEAMQQQLEAKGYKIVPFTEQADVYIINTCTVTNMADRKSRQMLHRAKKTNPNAIVVATGCYVQAAGEELQEELGIDLMIGNNKKKDLIALLEECENGKKEAFIIDINEPQEYEELEMVQSAEHCRAFVKVQDGCNQFCSYCIIPYMRGRVRSRKKEDVLIEIEKLVNNGYKEVVLTGIHLSSYGVDLENENLLSLIVAVHEIEGLKRIRLGSLEPRIVTEEFVKTLASLPKMCPHFHLSLQSGCDETLKRMNRRYGTKEYKNSCDILRKYFENPAITTDVIVGFPGETEEEFQETVCFLEEISFFEMHVFKYSKRKGTKAASMENQVDEQIKTKRSKELLAMDKKHTQAYLEGHIGKIVEVLMEEEQAIDGEQYWVGHTKEYMKVGVKSVENLENVICRGIIEKNMGNILLLCELEK